MTILYLFKISNIRSSCSIGKSEDFFLGLLQEIYGYLKLEEIFHF